VSVCLCTTYLIIRVSHSSVLNFCCSDVQTKLVNVCLKRFSAFVMNKINQKMYLRTRCTYKWNMHFVIIRPTATRSSVVCLLVSLRALQKRQNQSRCRLGAKLRWIHLRLYMMMMMRPFVKIPLITCYYWAASPACSARCGLLLQISHVAWSVCLFVLGWTDRDAVGLTRVSANLSLDDGQDRMNPFAAARGDRSAMRPFAKLLWIFVIIIIHECDMFS